MAKEWLSKHASGWTGNYSEKIASLLNANLYPRIGSIPMTRITAAMLVDAVRPIETRIAVQLLMLTFVRTGGLRAAQWHEFDFERREWRIPAARMKMRAPHLVPLSARAMTVLNQLREFSGYSAYLFPNHGKHPYMSENTINKAVANLGYKGRVVGHGFRATASTILNESGLFRPDIIERKLAHKEQNEIRAANHRAEYAADRAKMMQWWADFLNAKQRGGEVIALWRGA